MLTDDQARNLMRQAAETIEVGPARPVTPVRRRGPGIVVLAAAAAVAVAAGTAVALTRADPGPETGPATGSAGTPAPEQSSEAGLEPSPIPEGVVPVVFGYDEGTALRLLRGAGARRVITETSPGCLQAGRALMTEPVAGSPLGGSASIRLVVTSGADPDTAQMCFPEPQDALYWPLLDFSRGQGGGPDWAPQVVSAVQGDVQTVTNADDREAWPEGSALDALTEATQLTEREQPDEPERHFSTDRDDGSGRVGCPGAGAGQDPGLPQGLAGRPSSAVWMRHQEAGEMGPCVVVNIFDRQGVVDAVVVRRLTWQAPED